ncbi:hypothetical protein F7725_017612 [Dissostichus mawsoni]|uniref:Integrase catalytic domain-containing protein n=1 Tax=Dissostichus mawsoni TaxID=36200 RepID=A0A7J5Z710_DISMA|nr:hypothetical protein F7725_017612 [Dissostichus mawsoni]
MAGSRRLQGYPWLHLRAVQRGFVVSQETMRLVIKALDPEGVELRRARRLRRRQYHSRGPNALWHMDSYDKLKPYGIAINGCIDGFSRYIMWMEAYTTNSDPNVIADYYISAVTHIGGCPQRMRADRGTENGHIREMQLFLRRNHTDHHAGEGSFIYGCTDRIVVGVLRKQSVQFWMDPFKTLKDDGYFTGDFLDKNLVQFCFLNLLQEELDEVVRTWNTHQIRSRPVHGLQGDAPFSCSLCHSSMEQQRTDSSVFSLRRLQCARRSAPCDETVFELCVLLMGVNGWSSPGCI